MNQVYDTLAPRATGIAAIQANAEKLFGNGGKPRRKKDHARIAYEVLASVKEIDFRELAGLAPDEKLTQRHYRVLAIQEILRIIREIDCGLCRWEDFVYWYNGAHWQLADRNDLEAFLGEAARKMGVDDITARDFEFKAKLLKQFLADGYLAKPVDKSRVLINFLNGTFEINNGSINLRDFDQDDFLTYQLLFDYDPDADCPKWQKFLDTVLPDPDRSRQKVLAEYFGYVFVKHLKLEKTLMLYGTGANGKSVIFDVINALLGKENVSNYSLESLGENYFRAMIANKLLNYSSEISTRLQAEKFKQLTSGEPVEARLPYGQPMILTEYARLAFNCNELPRDVEHSEAFFRRFLIIPFDVTIPEKDRDPDLAQKIIESELSGVFNWVLDGLQRLLYQRGFSRCEGATAALTAFRRESDSVAMFLDEAGYVPSADGWTTLQSFYAEYRQYCLESGYKALGKTKLSKRLELHNIFVTRRNTGMCVAAVRG